MQSFLGAGRSFPKEGSLLQTKIPKNIVIQQLSEETVCQEVLKAENVFREKFAEGTRDIMRRIWRRYQSYVGRLRDYVHYLEEEIYLAAFAVHLNETEGLKGQTVAQYLCHLGNEYALRGSPLPLKKIEALKGAMHRRASPAIRACPMDLAGLKSFLAGPGLCDEEKTFLIIYWLSGQRPGDLINQKVCDIAMMENNHELQLSIWMYQMCKNTTTTERLSPRCVRMYVPAFWSDLVVNQIWRRREANEQQLFPGVKLHQIDQRLRKIPVVTRHPLLKEKHTLYSIRRGALQHLAAAGEDAVAIQQLTRHVSEASLRAYLGSFLDPRAIAGLEVSRKLGQYVAVPFEHPTTQTREICHNQATTSRREEKPDLDEPRTTLSAEKRGFTPAEETLLPLETIVETGSIQIQQESTPESLRKEVRPTNGPSSILSVDQTMGVVTQSNCSTPKDRWGIEWFFLVKGRLICIT